MKLIKFQLWHNVAHITGESSYSSKLLIVVSDLPFEEELLRNPHSLKSWLRYIESREDAGPKILNLLYERAIKELPGSFKLWHKYLTVRREQVKTIFDIEPHLGELPETLNAIDVAPK